MNKYTTETWKPVVGAEGWYEVSNLGNVRSLDREVERARGTWRMRGKALKPYPDSYGYLNLRISYPEGRRMRLVHQLVLEAFVGPKPSPLHCACHNNDVNTDNRVENLRWDIHDGNMQDIVRNGNHFMKNKTHCKRGHEFTPDNIYWARNKKGELNVRQCRTCSKLRYDQSRTKNIKSTP